MIPTSMGGGLWPSRTSRICFISLRMSSGSGRPCPSRKCLICERPCFAVVWRRMTLVFFLSFLPILVSVKFQDSRRVFDGASPDVHVALTRYWDDLLFYRHQEQLGLGMNT